MSYSNCNDPIPKVCYMWIYYIMQTFMKILIIKLRITIHVQTCNLNVLGFTSISWCFCLIYTCTSVIYIAIIFRWLKLFDTASVAYAFIFLHVRIFLQFTTLNVDKFSFRFKKNQNKTWYWLSLLNYVL